MKYLDQKLKWLTTQIESQTPAQVTRSQAIYLAWIDGSYLSCSEDKFLEALDAGGIGVQTNREFGLDETTGLFIRLNFAAARSILIIGINRLIHFLKQLDQC